MTQMETLTKKEEARSEYLVKMLAKHEAIVEAIKKELRSYIYKLDRKI